MSLESISIEKVQKHLDKQVVKKIQLMADIELSKALENAKNSLNLLNQADEVRGRKSSADARPQDNKKEKRRLGLIIDTIQQEQEARKNLK